MSKTQPKSASADADAPKKRSKLKLALLALVPLVLAGGGYGGWTVYAGAAAHDAQGAAEAEAAHKDPIKVSAVPTEIAAETSFTHSFALASIIAHDCGRVPVKALKAASNEEALADGLLINLSWSAAARRVYTLDETNCRHFLSEVRNADAKAARLAEAKAKAEKAKH